MEKELELVFLDAADEKKVITISAPKSDLNMEAVRPAMQVIIDANVFGKAGVNLVSIVEARYRTTQVTVVK